MFSSNVVRFNTNSSSNFSGESYGARTTCAKIRIANRSCCTSFPFNGQKFFILQNLTWLDAPRTGNLSVTMGYYMCKHISRINTQHPQMPVGLLDGRGQLRASNKRVPSESFHSQATQSSTTCGNRHDEIRCLSRPTGSCRGDMLPRLWCISRVRLPSLPRLV